jgi:hypothetical protein
MPIKDDPTEEIQPPPPIPTPQIPEPGPPPTAAPRRRWFGWLHARIAAYWLIPSILIVLMQFAYSYKPRLLIEENVAFDTGNPFNTSYSVTDTGPLHLNDLDFTCVVTMNHITFHMEGNVLQNEEQPLLGQPPIQRLDPQATTTRDCRPPFPLRLANMDLASLRIDVTVTFAWPFYLPFSGSATRHFSTRRRENGQFVLVPDVEAQ